MPLKERGRQNGDPIPINNPCQDFSEFKTQTLRLQAISLARRFPINAVMAEALAPMVFGVLS